MPINTHVDDKNLVLKMLEYGIEHTTFTYNELKSHFKFSDYEENFIYHHTIATANSDNPNKLFAIQQQFDNKNHDWRTHELRLLPTAVFQYTDYLEIVEARKSAQEAKRLSWIAIWISMGIGFLSLVIGGLQLYFQIMR